MNVTAKMLTMATCMASIASMGQDKTTIYQIPRSLLSGEGLDRIEQKDSNRTVFQKKVYDGVDIAIYMVAIGTGITNEFKNFPLEEFIFWINGKARVEPEGESAIEIQTGDYFVQAKGFRGKWNFIDIGGVHLELALIAKDRPDSTVTSPMSKALVFDRDLISGVSIPKSDQIYEGPELTVHHYTRAIDLARTSHERMIHVLNGILTLSAEGEIQQFFPGDFLVVPEGFAGEWTSSSLQKLRVFEVHKTKNR